MIEELRQEREVLREVLRKSFVAVGTTTSHQMDLQFEIYPELSRRTRQRLLARIITINQIFNAYAWLMYREGKSFHA